MIRFDCKGYVEDRECRWYGYISKMFYFGSHIQIYIQLANPVIADICKTVSGFFVFFINYEAGVLLSSLFDVDENVDRLSAVFVDEDAVTVAYAIQKVANLLPAPGRWCYCEQPVDDLPF